MTSTDRTGSATRRCCVRAERRADHERHVRHAVVDEEAVRALAVIAEALAVIAHDDDDGAVVDAERLQLRHDAPDLAVGEGNLAVVGMAPCSATRTARAAGRASARRRGESRQRTASPWTARIHGSALSTTSLAGRWIAAERNAARLAEIEVVEVGVESLVDAPLRVEDVGADEPAGAVAALP